VGGKSIKWKSRSREICKGDFGKMSVKPGVCSLLTSLSKLSPDEVEQNNSVYHVVTFNKWGDRKFFEAHDDLPCHDQDTLQGCIQRWIAKKKGWSFTLSQVSDEGDAAYVVTINAAIGEQKFLYSGEKYLTSAEAMLSAYVSAYTAYHGFIHNCLEEA
jgi:hypothetical protein